MNFIFLRLALPCIILPLSVLLLQHHSIGYWTELTTGAPPRWDASFWAAPWRGWGWSVLVKKKLL